MFDLDLELRVALIRLRCLELSLRSRHCLRCLEWNGLLLIAAHSREDDERDQTAAPS
jgi:hypothetical protein